VEAGDLYLTNRGSRARPLFALKVGVVKYMSQKRPPAQDQPTAREELWHMSRPSYDEPSYKEARAPNLPEGRAASNKACAILEANSSRGSGDCRHDYNEVREGRPYKPLPRYSNDSSDTSISKPAMARSKKSRFSMVRGNGKGISGGRHGCGIQHGSHRKTRWVINSVGKGNYLWDSGLTFHVHQLPKNLPGQAHEADPDDYDLYTASGEKLVVTQSSYVKSIGESVVIDINCRILSPVQLLLTGHRFEGWDRTIKITSKSGVICMGKLTADNEFVVSKSEIEKLLGETKGEY
jgi:hypothetical protein